MRKYRAMDNELIPHFRIRNLSKKIVLFCRVCDDELRLPKADTYAFMVSTAAKHLRSHLHASAA
jgi:hypothetical protein